MSWENEHEDFAAAIVAGRECGDPMRTDDAGAADNTHDFNIKTSQGTIAMEVTRDVDRSELQARAATPPEISGLEHGWVVLLTSNKVRVSELTWLGEVLRSVEASGLDRYYPTKGGDEFDLVSQGVRGVYRSGGNAGRLIVGTARKSEAVSAGGLNDMVERISSLDDNRSKLRKAEAIERHLFIWASDSSMEAVLALHQEWAVLPEVGPNLPPEVDKVWVCGAFGRWPRVSCRRGDAWEGPNPASDEIRPVV